MSERLDGSIEHDPGPSDPSAFDGMPLVEVETSEKVLQINVRVEVETNNNSHVLDAAFFDMDFVVESVQGFFDDLKGRM